MAGTKDLISRRARRSSGVDDKINKTEKNNEINTQKDGRQGELQQAPYGETTSKIGRRWLTKVAVLIGVLPYIIAACYGTYFFIWAEREKQPELINNSLVLSNATGQNYALHKIEDTPPSVLGEFATVDGTENRRAADNNVNQLLLSTPLIQPDQDLILTAVSDIVANPPNSKRDTPTILVEDHSDSILNRRKSDDIANQPILVTPTVQLRESGNLDVASETSADSPRHVRLDDPLPCHEDTRTEDAIENPRKADEPASEPLLMIPTTQPSQQRKKPTSDEGVVASITQTASTLPPTYQRTISPKKVFIDGRRIPAVELLPQKPNNSSVKVYLFNDLLSSEECDSLRKAHDRHVNEGSKTDPIVCFDSISTLRKHLSNVDKDMVKVSPRDFTPGTTCLNATFSAQIKTWLNSNWSYSTAFYPGESRFSTIMAQRLKDAMGLKPENGGKFQITSYPVHVGYKSHTDCTIQSQDKRDRFATVLVYLETVQEGGETEFPELGIWVKPKKGRALLWNNMDEAGNCEPLSIHQAKKVTDGHKYILQRWYYYESFNSLGKRPPEPALPARAHTQPRVTCDEYEHGSCRWYDEWNYEHIVEYNQKKHALV